MKVQRPMTPARDVVITCLFTRHPDPQSGEHWPSDPKVLTVLSSLQRHQVTAVVLYDDEELRPDGRAVYVHVDNDIPNAYWARWRHIADYVAGLEPDARVWCVDGGDVTLLRRDPFYLITDSNLYVGSEPGPTDAQHPRSVGFWWMRQLHPTHAAWIDEHADLTLLNVGLVGGHAREVRLFAEQLAGCWPTEDQTDMAAANRLLYSPEWVGRVITGDRVHTPMWSWRTSDPHAIWAHK